MDFSVPGWGILVHPYYFSVACNVEDKASKQLVKLRVEGIKKAMLEEFLVRIRISE